MPAVFAFADLGLDDPQIAAFAAFGSFAMLVLADFGGPVRARLLAYVSLALTGAALIAIATACSRNAWLAAGAMAVVGFGILFSGAINGYFAAGGAASILAFVLPVTIPAPLSAIPTRLEGWLLAAGFAIVAHFVLWPGRPPDGVRVKAMRACRALADVVEAELAGDRALVAETAARARAALTELRRAFVGVPHRPGGSSGREAALASLVDELEWLGPFVLAADSEETRTALCRAENREVMAAIVSVLRAAAACLDGIDERRHCTT